MKENIEIQYRIYQMIYDKHCKPCKGEKKCTNCHIPKLKEKPT